MAREDRLECGYGHGSWCVGSDWRFGYVERDILGAMWRGGCCAYENDSGMEGTVMAWVITALITWIVALAVVGHFLWIDRHEWEV